MTGFSTHLEEETLQNINFRKVIYTGAYEQLVLMSLKPGEEIGMEIHSTTDQFFRIEAGEAKLSINGVEKMLNAGDAAIVPAGAEHNVINISQIKYLKLYTIYSPAHHKDGTIHVTKQDAIDDLEDHL